MTITRTRWTEEEIQNLLHMHQKGMDVEFIARVLGRTDKAITAMLYRLGHGVKPVEEPKQLVLTSEEPVVTAKPKLPKQVQAVEVYVLTRLSQPSWFERLRCYLTGTKWRKTTDKVLREGKVDA
jgi:ParB-like chromosome segregation protein Spo0J